MGDIVERLRARFGPLRSFEEVLEAADEIERLTGERDRQYEYNVGQIARIAELETLLDRVTYALEQENPSAWPRYIRDARAALNGGK